MANHLEQLARQKAAKYGLGNWFVKQIGAESGFNAGARSPVGAQGVAQIMPATAKAWGVNPNDPAQALDAAAKHMASYVRQFGSVEKALRAYNAGPGNVEKSKGFAETNAYVQRILNGHTPAPSSSTSGSGSTQVIPGRDKVSVTHPFDQAGFDQATRRSQVGSFMAERRGPNDMLAKLLGTTAPDRSDFESTGVSFKPGKDRVVSSPGAPAKAGGGGVSKVDGKPVMAWMVPEIDYARQHGWHGTITSGIRSEKEQMSAAKGFGLNRYGPGGPLASNHVKGNPGAVDVSDPEGFAKALATYRGKRKLRRDPSINDPVHFSLTGR